MESMLDDSFLYVALIFGVVYSIIALKMSSRKIKERTESSRVYLKATNRNDKDLLKVLKTKKKRQIFREDLAYIVRVRLWTTLEMMLSFVLILTSLSLLVFK